MTSQATASSPSIVEGQVPEVPRSPARILLVEDNMDVLRATQRILSTQKYTILTAMDGEEALVRTREEMPDLLLLDVMLPKLDGLEVCRRLKRDPLTSGIMVILVTGRGSVSQRVTGLDAGADDYIPKPFHVPELLARIRSALRVKSLTDDLGERNRQILKHQCDLAQSEKMATIGLLAAGIAHEFNNIMAGISGYAQLAKKNPKYRDALIDVALTQTERALELTRGLSTYNRVRGAESECEVVKVIESVLCLALKEIQNAGIRLVKDFTVAPWTRMRPGELQEVLLNLVLNAIQAIEGTDGILRIRVDAADSPEKFVVEVTDNGQGIPEENLARIFDPFFTTKGALGGGRQPGTGLGLTVCYNVVQSHGGRIEVTSRVGVGTTFRITLPMAQRQADAEQSKPPGHDTSAMPQAPGRPLRILVVDDEAPVRELLRDALEGHEVVCCSSGESALEAYAIQRFDYVILDICIQNSMNGFQLFDRFEKEFSSKPRVIFASGRFPEGHHRQYLDRAHGHLLKPFKFESLWALLGLPAEAFARKPAAPEKV